MISWENQAKQDLTGVKLTFNRSMSEVTTFKIGGPVDLFVESVNIKELSRVLTFCNQFNVPWLILGLGSNMLVRDKGIRGMVIKLEGEFLQLEISGTTVTAGAGMAMSDLSHQTAEHGLAGLEFACGIPGSVGGAVFMNAGAYDGEIAQVLTRVQAFDMTQGLKWYEKESLEFGYRRSRFQNEKSVIVKLVFELQSHRSSELLAKMADLTCKREGKQPLELPSAGSVFRRPEGHFVGPMIEEAGLKGFSMGGAQVSSKHAGFIVNTGGATARDVLDLIHYIQKVIKERYEVDLIPEVKVVGEE